MQQALAIKSTTLTPICLVCSMVFSPNASPLAGKEGQHLTSTKIGDRLYAEAETSVSLSVLPASGSGEAFEVRARGELQLGLLIGESSDLPILCMNLS